MAKLKPWYQVIIPRSDLREGKPLDAAEFAVHLDQVRDGRARQDYQDPERFFARTFLTQNLLELAAGAVRRLAGETTESSAVFNMTTQFGGGKTHALTLMYHLANAGPTAARWMGVDKILKKADVKSVPRADWAVFVGTEFDSIAGRGGDDGTPLRKTPWGEIAFQLGGAAGFKAVEEHERRGTAPGGDVIRKFLPKDKPCLILMDELMNYVSRSRKSGLADQLYDFIHNLAEVARGQKSVVLAVSVPASELEMGADDQQDYERIKKILDRTGKAVFMSAEAEASEIIRRRLFDWDDFGVSQSGIVMLPGEAIQTCAAYAEWMNEHRQQLPNWFPIDRAREALTATYPFHPSVISVFERKWQALARFQRTRGMLRLLALWVARAYRDGYDGAHRDPLIGLGTAPLDDSMFRAALFEELGEDRLEIAATTDIAGRDDSNCLRLDKEAVDTIRKARLYRKVATAILFESNGGTTKNDATLPELRLAAAEPELDIGNVETVLEGLTENCYYLTVNKNRYRFSLQANLNKLLADRRASIQAARIQERVRAEVQKVFSAGSGVERVPYPEKSTDITERPVLTLAYLAPEHGMKRRGTAALIESMTREYGNAGRTFKSAIVWCVAEDGAQLAEEARKLLAWEDIREEAEERKFDEAQRRQLTESLKKAERDLREAVWRSYNTIVLLGKDNALKQVPLGLVHSSAADNLVTLILERLRQDGDLEKGISPSYLTRYWPPALKEWSTKAVRDVFYASPQFPRLMNPDAVKETIARGVESGLLAYVGKAAGGSYEPFLFRTGLTAGDVEISDDMFIVTADEAQKHVEPPRLTTLAIQPDSAQVEPGKQQSFLAKGYDQHGREIATGSVLWTSTGGKIGSDGVFEAGEDEGSFFVTAAAGSVSGNAPVRIAAGGAEIPPAPTAAARAGSLSWTGEVPAQKWMNFYTKVLSRFARGSLKLRVSFEVATDDGFSEQVIEETRIALRELGMNEMIDRGK
jgi:hypothetical protein